MHAAEAQNPPLTTREFLDRVLQLQPRVAAFDCDGTLWAGDSGERFFDWEIRKGIVDETLGTAMRARYADYKAGNVDEDTMCGEMVTMHAGIEEAGMIGPVAEFFNRQFVPQIFPEMRGLVESLHQHGCEVWAVSSSNEWVIRAGMKHFGIPPERILAAKVEVNAGVITSRLVRVPSGPGKATALREVARKNIDAAFGNSRWDAEMMEMATAAFAVNPNPDLDALARQRGWTVYFPEGTRPRA